MTILCFNHVGVNGFCHIPYAIHIYPKNEIASFDGEIFKAISVVNASIIVKDVNPAEFLNHFFCKCLRCIKLTYIHSFCKSLVAHVAQLLCRLLNSFRQVSHNNGCPVRSHNFCTAKANARRSTCNDCDSTV